MTLLCLMRLMASTQLLPASPSPHAHLVRSHMQDGTESCVTCTSEYGRSPWKSVDAVSLTGMIHLYYVCAGLASPVGLSNAPSCIQVAGIDPAISAPGWQQLLQRCSAPDQALNQLLSQHDQALHACLGSMQVLGYTCGRPGTSCLGF